MKSKKQITITPFLVVNDGKKALEFYLLAFAGRELERFDMQGGRLMAKLGIGDAVIWLGDEEPEFGNFSPSTIGGSGVRIVLSVDDPDTIFSQALKVGATQICPVRTEESWRIGKLADPFGHIWEIGTPLAEK